MTSLEAKIMEIASRSVIVRTADIVHELGVSQPVVSRALANLARRRMLTRIVRGLWGSTHHPKFSPYRAVPFLLGDREGRVSGYVDVISAMSLHGMISQIPGAIHVATRTQRKPLKTPIGTFQFHRIAAGLFDGYVPGDAHAHYYVASPTKALFDTLYLSVRRGRQWRYLPEIVLPRSVSNVAMQRWIDRLPSLRLKSAVTARWHDVREQIKRDAATAD
jgi:predicted transcriptional regulator of viral defense system